MSSAPPVTANRRLAVCLDDYGLHEGVDAAARTLIRLGRLSAASVMSDGTTWPASAGPLRQACREAPLPVDIGLHLNLTEPVPGHATQPLGRVIVRASLGLLDGAALRATIRDQLDRFEAAWGGPPDHVDGHQHVHQLRQVRRTLMDELARRYGDRPARPWLRCSEAPADAALPSRRKAHIISRLGARALRREAAERHWPTAGRLLGVYDFDGDEAGYRTRLAAWLAMARDGDLLMCHPGQPSGPDADQDVIAAARAREFAVWRAPDLPALFAQHGVTLAPMSRLLATTG
jgi:predicted glycoside hydrolase/deacetylase ChbG (UPF0249 family)